MNSDERIELTVLGLSYSQIQTGAYALILAQVDGPYRIPIVIGPAEAQSIAMRMENVVPPRPMTHDLFVSFAHAFGVKLTDVFIYRFEDGIFSSELTFSDGERTVKIDSRTSDAIAIAMRTRTPIYTTAEILQETGFVMEEMESEVESEYDDEAETEAQTDTEDINKGDEPQSPSMRMNRQSETNTHIHGANYENWPVENLRRILQRFIEEERYEEAARINEIIKRKSENH